MIYRIAAGLAAALLWATPASAWLAQKAATATTSRVLLSQTSSAFADGTSVFYLPLGFAVTPVTTAHTYSKFAVAGNLTEMIVRSASIIASGASRSMNVTVVKNGVDSAMTCTILEATQTCSYTAASLAVAAGDTFAIKFTQKNVPSTGRVAISFIFASNVATDDVILGHIITASTSAKQVVLPDTTSVGGTDTIRLYSVMPNDGTIDKLYVSSNAPSGSADAKKYTYAIGKGATSQTTTCDIQGLAVDCSDTSNSFTVLGSTGGSPSTTVGDPIQFQATPSGTPNSATAAFGARVVWGTANRFGFLGSFAVANNAASAFYYTISGGSASGSTTEANAQAYSHAMTMKKMAVKLLTAPGPAHSRTFTFRVDSADTALTCTIADTDTSCDIEADVAVTEGQRLATADVPAGSGTATTTPAISYLATR
jgi:hypothetical protein